MSYKNLVDILKRNGCESIELPSNDLINFNKYLAKVKYKDKLYFKLERGKFIISKKKL